ncbi:MAG: hypothetical protein CFE43_06475 [Burkholderiales bacterium PBB3]|nr:MAG: hypothetical protein CFE43_06475 [Burkholderiales bacterium PBB3]
MKRWIAKGVATCVLAACAAYTTGALAAPASPESVERMLAASKAEALLDGMRPQLHSMMQAAAKQASQGKPVTPQEQKIFLQFMEKTSAVIADETSMAKLKPMLLEIYAANFSQEEVDGITAFYESSVGQSLLTKQPAVIQAVLQGMPQRLAGMTEKLKKLDQEMRVELKAVRESAKPDSPPAADKPLSK